MTLQKFSVKLETIPASTSWYLADLSEARGSRGKPRSASKFCVSMR